MGLAVLSPSLFEGNQFDEWTADQVARILRSGEGWTVPDVDWYWPRMVEEWVRSAYAGLPGNSRSLFYELKGRAAPVALPALPPHQPVRDMTQLFGGLPGQWPRTMSELSAACLLTGLDTIVISRPIAGRDLLVHRHNHMRIFERLVWSVSAADPANAWHSAAVVRSERNIAVPWTRRFSSELPAESDGGAFPFCPPADWSSRAVDAVVTHSSRPCWRDGHDNHWADPDTPGRSEHWDLYLNAARTAEYGLGQLNIMRWGFPQIPKVPGDIHHVPPKKRPHLKKDTGWTC